MRSSSIPMTGPFLPTLLLGAALSACAALSGCAAAPADRPLTAEEKYQLLQAAQAEKLKRDLDTSRCGSSSKMAQLQARMGQFSGADAFDSRNCPRTGGTLK